jgi:hypothetical protein
VVPSLWLRLILAGRLLTRCLPGQGLGKKSATRVWLEGKTDQRYTHIIN